MVNEPTFARQTTGRAYAGGALQGRLIRDFIEESIPEATIYFTEPASGMRLRIRLDAVHPNVRVDLKTSRFALTRTLIRDAIDKDYDLQATCTAWAGLYEGVSAPKPFVFIVAENAAPSSVRTITSRIQPAGFGAAKFRAWLTTFQACSAAGYWPDLGSDGVIDIEPAAVRCANAVALGGRRPSSRVARRGRVQRR